MGNQIILHAQIFIISNGLDLKLKIGEKWGPLFSNEKEKFCFYFIKPDLIESEMNEIINIWNDFKEKTKTELAIISKEDILNGKNSTILSFKRIMHNRIYSNIEMPTQIKVISPEFKDIVKFYKDDY